MIPMRTPSALALLSATALMATVVANPVSAQTGSKPKTTAAPAAIYDTSADARTVVATASAKAKRDNTRVLVMFGFNTCGWCHKLHGLFEKNAEIHKLVHDEYVLAMVDIAAPNADALLKECKAALPKDEADKVVGYPFLAVLDSSGKPVIAQRTDPLEEGDHHDPKKVQEFLAKYVATPRDAREVLTEAQAKAASEDKQIFLHFGAPWCGWCHKLDDFLAREDVAKVFGTDYLDVKIDVDRMTNGKDMIKKYQPPRSGGIPWFAILDSSGKVLTTSDAKSGNIGYPAAPEEIDHFMAMLKQTRRRIEPEQLDRIKELLEKEGAKIRASR
jgi:thioredoxin-related protein